MSATPLNDLVLPLGYCSYADYLRSALWFGIRSRVYEAKGRVCLECKESPATEIHHRRYDEDTLRGLTLNYLIPICDPCHERLHGINRAKRLKQAEARKKTPAAKQQRKEERKRRRARAKAHRGEWVAPPTVQPAPSCCSKCQRRVKPSKLNKESGMCAGCEWTIKQAEIRKHNRELLAHMRNVRKER